MATKLQLVTELAQSVTKELSMFENWTAFLRSAAWQYKYSFEDQLLIFAQRPDATACADFDTWNNTLNRRINRGAKGIALLRERGSEYYLDYVFDISDTHAYMRGGDIRLWKYDDKYDDAIIETLENTFGELKVKSTLTDAVICAAHNCVQDNKADYLSELLYAKQGSFLEELDEKNIDMWFQSVAEVSIAYIIMQRMGLNPDEVFTREDFSHITDFNSNVAITVLGNAVSDMSEQALREISQTIRAEALRARTETEIFAQNDSAQYNVAETKEETQGERRFEDGHNIQNTDGSTTPESGSSEITGADREIRHDEEDISEESSQEPLFIDDDRGDLDGASGGDGQNSESTGGRNDSENGESGGRGREIESEEPAEVDRTDEQLPSFRRRGSVETVSSQLSIFELAEDSNVQLNMQREAERLNTGSAFSVPQQIIDEVLCDGPNEEIGKAHIYIQFSKQKPVSENVKSLKREYKRGGKGFIIDGREVSFWSDDGGIKIQYGRENKSVDYTLTWEQAEKRIRELLEAGRYMPQNEILAAIHNEKVELAHWIWNYFQEGDFEEFKVSGGYPEHEKAMAEALGDERRRDEIIKTVKEVYDRTESLPHYYIISAEEVIEGLEDLLIPRKMYNEVEYVPFEGKRFITQNEIDLVISKGANVSDSKMRIISFFLREQDAKKRADFLKNEYGIGGSSHSVSGVGWEDHDSKGLTLSKGDIMNPYDKITIPWTHVAKRISLLMKLNRYITNNDIEYMSEYEKGQVAWSIYYAYSGVPEGKYRPFPYLADHYKAIPIIKEQLDDEGKLKEIQSELRSLLLETKEDDRYYKWIKEASENIESYNNGTFNLFPGIERKNAELEYAKKLIDDFCVAEYEHGADFSNLREIGIAYTTVTDKEYPIEVNVNLVDFTLERYLNGKLIDNRGYDSLRELTEAKLEGLEFSDLTYVDEDIIAELEKGELNPVEQSFEEFFNSLHMEDDGETIALIPVGDFYEAYDADAEKAGLFLGLKLTTKHIDEKIHTVCGFPKDKLEDNMNILTENGFDVVITAEDKTSLKILSLEKALRDTPEEDISENSPGDVPWDEETALKIAKEEWEKATRPPVSRPTYEKRNYNFLKILAPEIIDGDALYARFESGGYMPLHINKINDDTIIIAHTYLQNGDVMNDPEMMFEIDRENGRLIPLTYRLDGMGIYQSVEEGNVSAQSLSSFAVEWFRNIKSQGFHKAEEALIYNGDDIRIMYNTKGNVIGVEGDEDIAKLYIEENGIELVFEQAEEVQEETIVPEFEKAKPVKAANTVIYPEIPSERRRNFVIDNDELGYGGAKEKFRKNMEAIRVLKECEAEHRLARSEEQEILSQYVGWGGLADAFDDSKANWANEYAELRQALTREEYEQARASTLNAHYTSPVIIKAMYKALENMGFREGNILEPSCGIGNFMGLVPESMSDSKIYGIEIDSITGRIAQQLYQKNSIVIQGFEDTMLPDSFFDVAIGNVPFGDYKLSDKKYNKHNFLIHDYFFAKTLDKVRPGGIVAFITTSGTMDKRNSKVRQYIAQRADLVGAIRLPNNAFLKNAGTEVTADILFLQKRDRMTDIMPDWVHLGELENGIAVNQYFVDNPDMILGEMQMVSGPFGPTPTCTPYENTELSEQLNDAIQNIHASITEYEVEDISNEEDLSIPADPNVKNFSYTIVDGEIYFRENSIMRKVELNATAQNRIKGMIGIRDCVRELIEYQTEGYSDYAIKAQQDKLNILYDDFTNKYGLINSRGNAMAFSDDSSYFLLCSLEIIDENGELERKADMFTKRTIGAKQEITKVDTSSEALAVSLGEKAKVDIAFMSELTGKGEDEIVKDLEEVIFLNPQYTEGSNAFEKYLPADEYLSGNVRQKLRTAELLAQTDERFKVNVEALKKVQPKDLSASEITVRLGSTWIPPEDIRQFVIELLSPGWYARDKIDVKYSPITGEWSITNKSYDKGVKATSTFGTHRINAYKIIEETLNLKDVRIFDYEEDAEGKKKPVLNKKETTIAQQKQDIIKAEFDNWIWRDPARRERLTQLYNERFNSTRPREYDGSHITFSGMNPEIALRKHQEDAVARIMYGGNSLLGHVVGAGKTWTMVAAAMESKRLGLCNKSLFVVPNHLTEQWAAEFLQLYPAANILVATKKDFETKNRKKFCGRIATGDYDAVIIGHSQFEKIPMSVERQVAILERQREEIMEGIISAKADKAERFTIKQLEKSKRSIEAKLAKLNDQSRKDDVVTFEELGVDRVFVDEAHYYKNLYLYTKMRNVGGIAQTEAQKSSDLFMKTQYLDEITGGKGVIFATGTPVSNSMVELYTMQRYLQYGTLRERGLQHFDAWASTFGETITAIELAPEGTGYRAKTRFAKFFNLPELMAMFKDVADIQTADMLNLPTPEPHYKTIAVEPTKIQKAMVEELADRAEKVRARVVDPSVDNMLKITNDGRKLALDQRLINPLLPDEEGSKVSACVDEVFNIWQETTAIRGTQLVFCDLSTPKNDGSFNVYTDIKEKLMKMGVPEHEIEFIHNADTEVKKKELFSKVRKGDVRILIGSTPKMGAGTNVQRLLYASHDLDCPWRPADLEQRAGRIIRQGNTNSDVHIRRYVTKDTFDSYMWQLVENKQKFISQIMTSKSPVRSAEDIDETALSYAEIKALATGNPHIKEKMDLDTQVAKLKLIKSSFLSQKYELEDKVIKYYPRQIADLTARIAGYEKDVETLQAHPKPEEGFGVMNIDNELYTEKEKAGRAILERCKTMVSAESVTIGEYRGFELELAFENHTKTFVLTLKGEISHKVELGTDVFGNIQRIDNALDSIPKRLETVKENLEEAKKQLEVAKVECQKEFPQEAELQAKLERLAIVDALLNMDKREREGADLEGPDDDEQTQRKVVGLER